jgi:hypothetical protein
MTIKRSMGEVKLLESREFFGARIVEWDSMI